MPQAMLLAEREDLSPSVLQAENSLRSSGLAVRRARRYTRQGTQHTPLRSCWVPGQMGLTGTYLRTGAGAPQLGLRKVLRRQSVVALMAVAGAQLCPRMAACVVLHRLGKLPMGLVNPASSYAVAGAQLHVQVPGPHISCLVPGLGQLCAAVLRRHALEHLSRLFPFAVLHVHVSGQLPTAICRQPARDLPPDQLWPNLSHAGDPRFNHLPWQAAVVLTKESKTAIVVRDTLQACPRLQQCDAVLTQVKGHVLLSCCLPLLKLLQALGHFPWESAGAEISSRLPDELLSLWVLWRQALCQATGALAICKSGHTEVAAELEEARDRRPDFRPGVGPHAIQQVPGPLAPLLGRVGLSKHVQQPLNFRIWYFVRVSDHLLPIPETNHSLCPDVPLLLQQENMGPGSGDSHVQVLQLTAQGTVLPCGLQPEVGVQPWVTDRPRIEGDCTLRGLLVPPGNAGITAGVVLQNGPAVVPGVGEEVDEKHNVKFLSLGLGDGETHNLISHVVRDALHMLPVSEEESYLRAKLELPYPPSLDRMRLGMHLHKVLVDEVQALVADHGTRAILDPNVLHGLLPLSEAGERAVHEVLNAVA
mmetsp:Transcript_3614/g.6259  ORF Transcript_3614/g.6259 Transcript_3614/m.6259 type:complete len:589 (+) Transcript_3614:4260-6026(+)